jgi:small conductance mechanosensitive channel
MFNPLDWLFRTAIQVQDKIDLTPLKEAARMPAEVKEALPALTVMMVNGGINLLIALAILMGGWMLSRWMATWLRRGLSRSHVVDETLKPLLATMVRYVIMAITLVIVLGHFGIQTTSLIALVGAAGLAIGLALQGALSNVASGTMLLILRPFRVGDLVVVGSAGTSGTVREISLFTTVMITPDLQYVAVPNSQIFGNTVTNYTREPTRRVNIIVGIDYEDSIEEAQAVLLDIMHSDKRIHAEPAPIARVDALAASSVNLVARCFVDTPQHPDVVFDMLQAIKTRFDEAGITIPFPQQTENARVTKTPPESRDKPEAER